MAFKMKGFPMQSSKSALKQTTSANVINTAGDDMTTPNLEGRNTKYGDLMFSAGSGRNYNEQFNKKWNKLVKSTKPKDQARVLSEQLGGEWTVADDGKWRNELDQTPAVAQIEHWVNPDGTPMSEADKNYFRKIKQAGTMSKETSAIANKQGSTLYQILTK